MSHVCRHMQRVWLQDWMYMKMMAANWMYHKWMAANIFFGKWG